MKITIPFIFLFICTYIANSQIDANNLISFPNATTTELDAITSPTPQLGSVAFDTTKDRLVEYTSSGWKEIITERNVYVGFFTISAPGGTTATTFRQEIVDIPFQPSQIQFTAHANIESFGIDSAGSDGLNTATLQNAFGTMNGIARDNGTTITQATIYIGGSGSSINSISRYSSNTECIGLRYGNQNAVSMGKITGDLFSFDSNGFTLDISYTLGSSGNTNRDNDILNESLIVFYTAYK